VTRDTGCGEIRAPVDTGKRRKEAYGVKIAAGGVTRDTGCGGRKRGKKRLGAAHGVKIARSQRDTFLFLRGCADTVSGEGKT
jgi:hypothetical protein